MDKTRKDYLIERILGDRKDDVSLLRQELNEKSLEDLEGISGIMDNYRFVETYGSASSRLKLKDEDYHKVVKQLKEHYPLISTFSHSVR